MEKPQDPNTDELPEERCKCDALLTIEDALKSRVAQLPTVQCEKCRTAHMRKAAGDKGFKLGV